MTTGLPQDVTFLSPRVKGTYQGAEVIHHQDKVELRLHVSTQKIGTRRILRDTKPLILFFSKNAFADLQFELYRFSEKNGPLGNGMWDEYQKRERNNFKRRKGE